MATFSGDSTSHTHALSPPPPPGLLQSPKHVICISAPTAKAQPPLTYTNKHTRSEWLRAAVLGAPSGIVPIASLIIGVGAINQTPYAIVVFGVACLIAGACSMAIGEYVSVYVQYDIEVAHRRCRKGVPGETKESQLPSPGKAAAASALSFTLGGAVPLLASGFIESWRTRVLVAGAVSSTGLAAFGATGAVLGGSSVGRTATRVLLGGWIAMLATCGVVSFFSTVFIIDN